MACNIKEAVLIIDGGSSEWGRSLVLYSAVRFGLSIMLVAFLLFFYWRNMYWLPFLKFCSLESWHAHFEALIVASSIRRIQCRVHSFFPLSNDHWLWLLQPRSEGPCSPLEAELRSQMTFMAFYLLHSSHAVVLPWFLAIDTVDPTFRKNTFSLCNWKHISGLAHRSSELSCTPH